jgi:DNA-binding Lrp family transcriptional regulator
MDKIDRQMLVMLGRNPRTTYRQLAEQLHLSIPALQRRLQTMESTKQIVCYHALVNLEAMNGVRTIVFGQMAGKMDSDMLSKIERQGSIHTVSYGGLNNVYLLAHLRHILELDNVTAVAQDVCKISNPSVVIFGYGSIISTYPPTIDDSRKGDVSTLSEIDYRIIKSLHYNARKPISTIAKEVDLSAKTVRKRLSRMIDNNLLELRTITSIEGSGVLVFFVVVRVKDSESRPAILKKIRDDPQFYVESSILVSNASNQLFFEMQTETVNEMSRVVEDIRGLKEVESVSPDLIQKAYYFDIWRDQMLEEIKTRKGKR